MASVRSFSIEISPKAAVVARALRETRVEVLAEALLLTAAEAKEQLLGALVGWDWANYFPSDYTGTIGVDVTTEWPSDQLQNISPAPNGMLKKPLISVTDLTSRPAQGRNGAALGKVLGAGAG